MLIPTWLRVTAPAFMVLSLFTGILLAIGHHLFYSSLDGTQVHSGVYRIAGTNVSPQQYNIAVGTTFAFLVKASLTLAVSIAYTQAFWRAAKASEKGRQLSTLDTLYSALDNALAFFQVHIWIKFPLLLLIAIIVWYVEQSSRGSQ